MPDPAAAFVAAFIADTNTPDGTPEASFAALLEAIHARRFTGTMTLHFQRGQPRAVDFPQPLRVTFSPTT